MQVVFCSPYRRAGETLNIQVLIGLVCLIRTRNQQTLSRVEVGLVEVVAVVVAGKLRVGDAQSSRTKRSQIYVIVLADASTSYWATQASARPANRRKLVAIWRRFRGRSSVPLIPNTGQLWPARLPSRAAKRRVAPKLAPVVRKPLCCN